MKSKFRNYGLWISIISAVLMLLQAMGLKFDVPYVNEIITSVLGVLVTLGIISNPSDGSGYSDKSVLTQESEDKVATEAQSDIEKE